MIDSIKRLSPAISLTQSEMMGVVVVTLIIDSSCDDPEEVFISTSFVVLPVAQPRINAKTKIKNVFFFIVN